MKEGTEWVMITVLAFMGGVAANIVKPKRRGAWGFFGAAVVGGFCGFSAAAAASAFGAADGVQWSVASILGVTGDRVLVAILETRSEMQVNVHGGQNNIGDNDIGGDQNHE